MMQVDSFPIWVRPRKACGLTGFGLTRLYELLADGTLESKKIGRARLVSVASIQRLGEQTDAPKAA